MSDMSGHEFSWCQRRLRGRAVRALSTGPGVGRSGHARGLRRASAGPDRGPSAGAPAPVAGRAASIDGARCRGGRRRRQPRRVHPQVRASRGPARSARQRPFGPSGDPSLAPEAHGVTPDDLRRLPASLIGGPIAARAANALEAIEALRQVYCSTTGYDYAHIFVPEEREWLRYAAESGQFRPPVDAASTASALLDRLTPGRSLRAVPAPHVPGQDALLGRRPRHADPGPRRDRRGRRRRPASRTC